MIARKPMSAGPLNKTTLSPIAPESGLYVRRSAKINNTFAHCTANVSTKYACPLNSYRVPFIKDIFFLLRGVYRKIADMMKLADRIGLSAYS